MSLFGKLFGGKANTNSAPKAETKPELYANDFLIYPEPIKEASGYRIAARIEKEIDGEMKSHLMIRADTIASEEDAIVATVQKAQIFIDQMGEAMFD